MFDNAADSQLNTNREDQHLTMLDIEQAVIPQPMQKPERFQNESRSNEENLITETHEGTINIADNESNYVDHKEMLKM